MTTSPKNLPSSSSANTASFWSIILAVGLILTGLFGGENTFEQIAGAPLVVAGVLFFITQWISSLRQKMVSVVAGGFLLGIAAVNVFASLASDEMLVRFGAPRDASLPTITATPITLDNAPVDYHFTFTAEATEILVNGTPADCAGSGCAATIPLPDRETKITILARNDSGERTHEVTITRPESDAERVAREEGERVGAEAKEAVERAKRIDKAGETAFYCSQVEVEKMLRSPSSADFPTRKQSRVKVFDDFEDHFRVESYVEAKNAFGVMIRQNYACNVHVLDAAGMTCVSECSLF